MYEKELCIIRSRDALFENKLRRNDTEKRYLRRMTFILAHQLDNSISTFMVKNYIKMYKMLYFYFWFVDLDLWNWIINVRTMEIHCGKCSGLVSPFQESSRSATF